MYQTPFRSLNAHCGGQGLPLARHTLSESNDAITTHSLFVGSRSMKKGCTGTLQVLNEGSPEIISSDASLTTTGPILWMPDEYFCSNRTRRLNRTVSPLASVTSSSHVRSLMEGPVGSRILPISSHRP